MYLIARGEVEVLDVDGKVIKVLHDGDFFGEIGVLMSKPRTATCARRRAATSSCSTRPTSAASCATTRSSPTRVQQVAKERYQVNVNTDALIAPR